MTKSLDLSLNELIERQRAERKLANASPSSPLMSDEEHDARMDRVVEALNSTLDELVERHRRGAQPTCVSRAAAPRHAPYRAQARVSESGPKFKRVLVKPFPTDVTVEQARDFFQIIAGPVKEVYLGMNMAEIVFRETHGYRAFQKLDGCRWRDNGKIIRVIPVYGPRRIDQVSQGLSTARPQDATNASTLTETQRRRRRRAEAARVAVMASGKQEL